MSNLVSKKQADDRWIICDKETKKLLYGYDLEKNICSTYSPENDDMKETCDEARNNKRKAEHSELNSVEDADARSISIDSKDEVESQAENLPIEIICKIMGFLELSDRKRASIVCKKWRSAFFENCFFKNVVFKANNQLLVQRRPTSSSFAPSLTQSNHRSSNSMALDLSACLYDNIIHLEFEHDAADVSLLMKHLEMKRLNPPNSHYSHLLPKLHSLKLNNCTLSSRTLVQLLKEAPNLRSLTLNQCDSLFMSGFLTAGPVSTEDEKNKGIFTLANLSELSMSRNRYLTDHLLNLFIQSTPKLSSLDLSYCHLTKSNFKFASMSLSSASFVASKAVLTLENLLRLLEDQLRSLSSLNLTGIDLFNHDDNSLLTISTHLSSSLVEIKLARLPLLNLNGVIKMLGNLKQLKQIDLNDSIIQNDEVVTKRLEIVLKALVAKKESVPSCQLETLKFNKAKILDPYLLLESIAYMTSLRYLDLSAIMFQCSFGTMTKRNMYIDEFASGLANAERLEHLILSYSEFLVNDSFVKIIAERLVHLKHLDLRNCTQITDDSMHSICSNLKKLVHLDLSWCQKLSDYGLDNTIVIDGNQKLLNELNAGRCRCLKKYVDQPFLLIKTKADFNSNEKPATLCTCTEALANPEQNKKEKTERLQRDKIINISDLKNLRCLRLEACLNISDAGLAKLDLAKLNELDVKLCTNVTGDFIQLKKSGSPNLRVLNLNQCINFREQALVDLIEQAENLRELSLSAIPSVTNRVISILLENKRLLNAFDVSFCSNVSESYLDKYEQFLYNQFGMRDFHLDKRFINK